MGLIPSQRAHLHVAAVSHPGMSGKSNEDRYGVSAFQVEDGFSTPALLAVLADGIGGHRAGEIAAEIAVEAISNFIAAGNASQPVKTLREAFVHAGRAISESAGAVQERRGMGTTCACVWIVGDQLYLAAVGDSRIYLVRGNQIQQLTRDHTWVQEAVSSGALDPDQARRHPNAHVIRRYLGSFRETLPDMRLYLRGNEDDNQALENQGVRLLPGDTLLLCSDGLTDLVNNAEILAALTHNQIEEALKRLMNLANQRGGHDNITIVSLRLPRAEPETQPLPLGKPKSKLLSSCITMALLLSVLAALAGSLYLSFTRSGELAPTPTQQASVTLNGARAASSTPLAPTFTPQAGLTSAAPGMSTSTPAAGGSTPSVPASQATLTPWPTNTPSGAL
ncbi:MAG: protein phosphatase 2C domain-containing protein [Anaerolineales bacterium]|nr:protein phosphatase 2C domain-containing protein [Anaerolineales bacterium]